MNELIEECLRIRGVRFFRGRHDDEYFHLVHTGVGRLYVHIEVCGPDRDTVQISISPDHYYPAADGERLHQAVARWNAECREVGALVVASSDPNLVGLAAGSRYRGDDPIALGEFVDGSLLAAVELFGLIGISGGPAAPTLASAS